MKSKIHVTRTLLGILLASALLTAAVPAIAHAVPAWSGWREIAGAGATTEAPVALYAGGQVHVFVRGLDNRVYRNVQGGTTWSGWVEIPGGGATESAPSAIGIGFREDLHVYIRGLDNRIYLNALVDPNPPPP